jgi:glycosyltransferase involved in cell wall biosynthesis
LQGLLATQRFDALLVEGLEMTPYLDVIAGGDPRPLIVYDAHNAEHVLQRRAWENDRRRFRSLPAALYSWIQWDRLRRLEADVCHRVDLVICTSEPDRRALAAVAPGLEPLVVPNGVDTAQHPATPPTQRSEGRLVFVGKMDYRPNRDAARWFAETIFPRIRAERSDVQFLVVGRDPTPAVRRLGRLSGVRVIGAVDDVHRYFREAAVAVAPLRMGGGTRIKILEAMANGTPNVATTIAVEGLEVEKGRDLLIADTASELAHAVLELLADREKAHAIGQAGRRLVTDRYDWKRLVPPLEAALETRR